MLRLSMIVLLIFSVLMPIQAQTPDDETIWHNWLRLSIDQKIEILRNYYTIEHAEPEIVLPEMTALLTNDYDLFIFPLEDNPGTINIYYLSYEFEMPTYLIEDFYVPEYQRKDLWVTGLISGGACLALGFMLGVIFE